MKQEAPPCRPTKAQPGTEGKVAVLAARYEAGQSLWNARDATREGMVAGQVEAFGELLEDDWEDDGD